jgi:hypothetical protein
MTAASAGVACVGQASGDRFELIADPVGFRLVADATYAEGAALVLAESDAPGETIRMLERAMAL